MDRVLVALQRFRWQQWLVVAAFVAALAFAGLHAVVAVRQAAYLRAHGQQPIAAWMTVGHVAHAYHVAPEVLEDALGLPRGQRDRRPLRMIAGQRGESLETVRARLLEAIARAQGAPGGAAPPGGAPSVGTGTPEPR